MFRLRTMSIEAQRLPIFWYVARMPAGWERHWSVEYGMPYWWNSITGVSQWERPRRRFFMEWRYDFFANGVQLE